jgi:HK97 gp10 family phage protein
MKVEAVFNDHGAIKQFQAMPKAIDDAVKKAVNLVGAEAVREMTGKEGLSKYGRHQKGTPTPSPPGEPPAQVSTNLRRSVKKFPVTRKGHGEYSVEVMPTAVYARAQELGNGRLPARPFVEPARKRLRANKRIERIFRETMYKELKKRHA